MKLRKHLQLFAVMYKLLRTFACDRRRILSKIFFYAVDGSSAELYSVEKRIMDSVDNIMARRVILIVII